MQRLAVHLCLLGPLGSVVVLMGGKPFFGDEDLPDTFLKLLNRYPDRDIPRLIVHLFGLSSSPIQYSVIYESVEQLGLKSEAGIPRPNARPQTKRIPHHTAVDLPPRSDRDRTQSCYRSYSPPAVMLFDPTISRSTQ